MSKVWPNLDAVAAENAASGGKKLLVVRDNCVYDVATFLTEHPGGPETLQGQAGKDITRKFAQVGHSPDAVKLLSQFCVGTVASSDAAAGATPPVATGSGMSAAERAQILAEGRRGAWKAAVLPWVAGAVAAVGAYVAVASWRQRRNK